MQYIVHKYVIRYDISYIYDKKLQSFTEEQKSPVKTQTPLICFSGYLLSVLLLLSTFLGKQ